MVTPEKKLTPAVTSALIDILGKDRYLDSPEALTCYAYDAFLEEAVPEAVAFPRTTEEVSKIMALATTHKIPVTARGAGTSVCGAPVPVHHGLVLCFSKMDQIIEINTKDRYAIVEPGVVNADLQAALAPFGFFYPPDPGSMAMATIGGNIAQNAGGPRCLKYGVTLDYLLGIEAVLADGRMVQYGSRNVKDVTGYKMAALFCGSEGTLGLTTKAIVKVVPIPEAAATLTVTFNDLNDTANAVADIIGSGILPAAMELMDEICIKAIEGASNLGLDTQAAGLLLIEVDGTKESCASELDRVIEKLEANNAKAIQRAQTEGERQKLWQARRAAYGSFAKLAPDILSEDVTVPVSQVPEMIRRCKAIGEKYGLTAGVLAHAGDGNMHPMFNADRNNTEEWDRITKAFDEIFEAAADLGGTLSGEHGVGLAKTKYLGLVMNQDSRDLMTTIKRAVDPDNILNPGKFA